MIAALPLVAVGTGCAIRTSQVQQANSGATTVMPGTMTLGPSGLVAANETASGNGAAAARLTSDVTCVTSGTDGLFENYEIRYDLKTYSDRTSAVACTVVSGTVLNLECPPADAFAVTFSIRESATSQKQVSETFDPGSSACDVANY